MSEAYEDIAEGLPDNQKVEFFRTLHEARISPRDVEFAKILRALQLYKAYYETIPESIKVVVADVEKLKSDIGELVSQADRSVDAAEMTLNHLTSEAALVNESLKNIHSHVEDAAEKASSVISNRMTAVLEKALPLANLSEAGRVFTDAVESGKEAAAELRNNIKIIRRAHYRNFALAAVSLILVFWVFIYGWYELRLERERAAFVSQFEDNRAILLELAKSRRRLELTTGEKGSRLLIMRDATGWTSKDKHGVIEFKE